MKHKLFFFGLTGAVLVMFLAGCSSDLVDNLTPTSSVTGVAVSPPTATAPRGGARQFTPLVSGNGDKTVVWSLDENTHQDTTISSFGLLSVSKDETATTLTVRATSTLDPSKSGTAIVTLTAASSEAVTSVTVSPETAEVAKGGAQQFAAAVVTTVEGTDQTVIWSVTGAANGGTAIDNSGSLIVAADETATTLTVKAMSTVDTSKVGTATVTVTEASAAGSVTSVTVSPATAEVIQGESQQFTAVVAAAEGTAQTVVWTVTGNTSADTKFSGSTLTVAADESAATLTVRASSTVDASKSGTATVTVKAISVDSVTVSPDTAEVGKGGARQFTATVTVTGNAAQTVVWTVTGNTSADTKFSGNTLTVAAGETAATLTVTATSTVDASKSGTAIVTVTAASSGTVTSVTVDPNTVAVVRGKTQQFSAAVVVTGGAVQTVAWSVTGNGKKDGTAIDGNGLLTVAADETAATLTVTATSTVDASKSGTAAVTVKTGEASLAITIGFAGGIVVTGDNGANQISKSGTGSLTLTATGGYTTPVWYVDGAETGSTGQSITLEAADYEVRRHSVTFTGYRDGTFYSKAIAFTVIE